MGRDHAVDIGSDNVDLASIQTARSCTSGPFVSCEASATVFYDFRLTRKENCAFIPSKMHLGEPKTSSSPIFEIFQPSWRPQLRLANTR